MLESLLLFDSVPEAFPPARILKKHYLLILIKQVSHWRIVELDVYLSNSDRLENHAGVGDDIFGIDVFANFKLNCTNIVVTAESPKVRLLHRVDARKARDLLITSQQCQVESGRLTLHKHHDRFLRKRHHAQSNQNRDEHRTNRICNHPAEEVHQTGGDDHANRAKRVGENVKEHSAHDL